MAEFWDYFTDDVKSNAWTSGLVYDIIPIIPNDAIPFANAAAIGLYIETAGTLVFRTFGGATRTVVVPDFFTLTCAVTHVLEASTCEGIHALMLNNYA